LRVPDPIHDFCAACKCKIMNQNVIITLFSKTYLIQYNLIWSRNDWGNIIDKLFEKKSRISEYFRRKKIELCWSSDLLLSMNLSSRSTPGILSIHPNFTLWGGTYSHAKKHVGNNFWRNTFSYYAPMLKKVKGTSNLRKNDWTTLRLK